jgi:hypothetical protein
VNPPAGKTAAGVTVWPLPRRAGQETGLRHLTWGGAGGHVHLCAGGVRDEAGQEWYGQVQSEVSGSCATQADAQRAADAYLASLKLAAAS